jgi:hypothetical protein
VALEAFQLIGAGVPTSVFSNIAAFLSIIEEKTRRSSEILLSVRIIALTPLVFGIYLWAE